MLKSIVRLFNYLRTNKFALLLISLLLLIVVPVFTNDLHIRSLLSYFFISIALFVSILIFYRGNNKFILMGIVVVVITVVLVNWIEFFSVPGTKIGLNRAVLLLVIFSMIFINIFREFRRREETSIDFIYGAISGFFLLGVIGALLCFIVNDFYPESFSFVQQLTDFRDFIYFSFVTLTTLGYGDVLPLSSQGEMLAVLIAIIGQLYLTIIIALIIGKYLASAER